MAGITETGFEVKRLQDIKDDMDASLRASISEDLTLTEDDTLGQIRGVFAGEVQLLWEAGGDLYTMLDPYQAEGSSLDVIGRFYRKPRLGDVRATGTITASGTPGTLIPTGTQIQDPDTLVIVETTELLAIEGGGEVTIAVQVIEPGAVLSTVDGLTTIVTPVTGFDDVVASTVLSGGRVVESDPVYRSRLARSREGDAGPEGAIRAALLEVEGVATALVKSNRTLSVDAIGTPGKATRIVIAPDLTGNTEREALIAGAIFRTLGAGCRSYGDGASARTASVLDKQGDAQEVSWEYVIEQMIYVELDFDVSADESTLDQADTEAVAKQAIVDFVNGLAVGEDVSTMDLIAAVVAGVPGASNVNTLRLDTVDPPVNEGSISVAFNRRAVSALASVTVSATLV